MSEERFWVCRYDGTCRPDSVDETSYHVVCGWVYTTDFNNDSPTPQSNERLVEATDDTPQVFIDALVNSNAPDGVHRVVYLNTTTGKRTTSFITLGEGVGSVLRSYVFFPYLMAKDISSGAERSDPWEAINGLGEWPSSVPGDD